MNEEIEELEAQILIFANKQRELIKCFLLTSGIAMHQCLTSSAKRVIIVSSHLHV